MVLYCKSANFSFPSYRIIIIDFKGSHKLKLLFYFLEIFYNVSKDFCVHRRIHCFMHFTIILLLLGSIKSWRTSHLLCTNTCYNKHKDCIYFMCLNVIIFNVNNVFWRLRSDDDYRRFESVLGVFVLERGRGQFVFHSQCFPSVALVFYLLKYTKRLMALNAGIQIIQAWIIFLFLLLYYRRLRALVKLAIDFGLK